MLLYLHIPFCHRVCPYCSFYKHTPGSTPIGQFISALGEEARARVLPLSEKPRTLYLGGGTPSMLSPGHLRDLFRTLAEVLDFSGMDEIAMEANPATFDERKAEIFREIGITRISLGIQSFSAEVLKTLGREHSPEQAARSVEILRAAGIPRVNIDLMFSVPGQCMESWHETVTQAIDLSPDHISAYNLTYEEDTAFFESLKRGEMAEDEQVNAEFFFAAKRTLERAGFLHYETSNYARPGCESAHNLGYWRGEDYLGLGPSAVSTIKRVRTANVADTAAYIARIGSLGNAAETAEEISDEAWRLERIALGLRTREGIDARLLDAAGRKKAETLAEHALVKISDRRIQLADRGIALADPISAELV